MVAARSVMCSAPMSIAMAHMGPNLELYEAAVRRFPKIAWQASGGVRDAGDLTASRRRRSGGGGWAGPARAADRS